MAATLHHGDCREILRDLPAESFDSCVTDPPYELGFMGKAWDRAGVSFDPETWAAVLRVLKPGAHLLAFGGPRTVHRIAVAIEDAGFEIRDQIAWMFGSGFPKSLDVSKAIDKAAGAQREVVGFDKSKWRDATNYQGAKYSEMRAADYEAKATITAPATDLARQWDGWGTALKPAWESIVVAQKPSGIRHICGIMAPTIKELACRSWSLAKDADGNSASSLSASDEASVSALWSAVAQSSTPDDLYGQTAMWPSAWATTSNLNIAWSWLGTLGAIWTHASTFTTETASSLTTDLKTLNSLLSTITPESIIRGVTGANGGGSSVWLADQLFSGAQAKLLLTLGASAHAPAISTDAVEGLRPDADYIIVARKPLVGTVAQNVTTYGTGAINVDACRIAACDNTTKVRTAGDRPRDQYRTGTSIGGPIPTTLGRWPANVCLDEDAARLLDAQSGFLTSGVNPTRRGTNKFNATYGTFVGQRECVPLRGADTGGASRFFYVAKASRSERNAGLDGMPEKMLRWSSGDQNPGSFQSDGTNKHAANHHPTVKPIALMRWLVRLVTPPGGTVLDPFMGSGSTGIASQRQGFQFVGIEVNEEYFEIATRRVRNDAPLLNEVQ